MLYSMITSIFHRCASKQLVSQEGSGLFLWHDIGCADSPALHGLHQEEPQHKTGRRVDTDSVNNLSNTLFKSPGVNALEWLSVPGQSGHIV